MTRCPNCSYLLVFLERKRKYKCARCSRLYSQSEIKKVETKQFKEKHILQRIEDKKEKIRDANREYFKTEKGKKALKKGARKYYLKNKAKIRIEQMNYRKKKRAEKVKLAESGLH